MAYDTRDLIINRPELVPRGQKLTAWSITLFFWGALLYLWQPLLSLVAWGLNINFFYHHMILLGGIGTLGRLLLFYATVIAVLGGSLILWARVQQWRFRGRERRRGIGATDLDRLCAGWDVSREARASALASAVVTVHFAADGRIAELAPRAVSGALTEPGRAVAAAAAQATETAEFCDVGPNIA